MLTTPTNIHERPHISTPQPLISTTPIITTLMHHHQLPSQIFTSPPHPLDATDQFDLLRVKDRNVSNFPASIKIAVWNCRGVASKSHSVRILFASSGADILILNETFRRSSTPWPGDLPPCLAEATALVESQTRQPSGVAVLVNPASIGLNGSIRSFSILEVDNVHGLKVVLRVNQFTLVAVYVPTSLGPDFLRSVLSDANLLVRDHQPVILCGDLNATHSVDLASNPTALSRHRILAAASAQFHRVDTGPEPTRPSNRIDSVDSFGTIIDHIYGQLSIISTLPMPMPWTETAFLRLLTAVIINRYSPALSQGLGPPIIPCVTGVYDLKNSK